MLTIETWLRGLGRRQALNECPVWPPDLYAISGALLKRSGAYLRVFERNESSGYLDNISVIGASWRQCIEDLDQPLTPARFQSARPKAVERAWRQLIRARKTPISEIPASVELTESLIRMALIADEASVGIGIEWDRSKGTARSTFLSFAERVLSGNGLSSFCWEIGTDLVCVLGKQHTPQRGATFRSLTHHLSLYLPNDIEARWVNPVPRLRGNGQRSKSLNLLLLPWPITVETGDFSEVRGRRHKKDAAERSAYFRFSPRRSPAPAVFVRQMERAIRKAREHAGAIDAIVLPELALSLKQFYAAERIALRERTMLISGVRLEAEQSAGRDLNLSVLQLAGAVGGLASDLRLFQAKHHRWCLDHDQIVSYQLAGRLPASRACWENIELLPRVLHFATLNRLTWSVLVCEDLARQDPVADLIRAVGPNLLIALLMDGPQLSGRWPARYASVLAEDPGSSVLTITSLGMAERSRPLQRGLGKRADRSRVVAMWRDAISGETQIEMDPGDDACVLTLECRMLEEYTADGRGDGAVTNCPVFAGYRSFRTSG
jgi:hypothetical protein